MNKIPITWLDKFVQINTNREKAREEYASSAQGMLDYFLRNDLYNYNMYGKFPSEHPSVQEAIESLKRFDDPYVLSKKINDALDRLRGPKKKHQHGSKKENSQQ